jgi:RNA polymerase sigma factor (sigma-70 family)
LRYGGNSVNAQDILQNGLIRVFTALKQFDDKKGNFLVWSNKIMVNEALRFLQKQKRINFFEPVDESHLQIGVENNIHSLLSAKELVQLIQQLPDGYRTVFNLYTIEGYSHKEISQKLNISEGTSKSQLSKAKKQLRQWIEVLL